MQELAKAPPEQTTSPVVIPQPLTPHEFVDALKRCARGESISTELRERSGMFVSAYLKPESEEQRDLKLLGPERDAVRAQLRDELRSNLQEILASSAPRDCSISDRSTAREAKRVAAELFVALEKDLKPISQGGGGGFGDLTARGEEAHHIKNQDDVSALRLAFTYLETLCRQHAPDKISVGALEKGLKSAPFGSDPLAKLGSGFFQAHRNDLLHARGDLDRPLAGGDIHHCITFLTTRASPAGVFAELADPLLNGLDIENWAQARHGPFQRKILHSEHELITDEVLKRLEKEGLPPELQRFKDEGLLDLSNADDRDWARGIARVDQIIPIGSLCDFRVSKALLLARESATAAIAQAGLTLQAGEDPLRVVLNHPATFFGGSDDRIRGWEKVIKELTKLEKSGGYFASGRPDVKAGEAAQEPLPAESKRDEVIGSAAFQRMAMEQEADFVVSLCAILSHDLNALTAPHAKHNQRAAQGESIDTLREEIVRHLTSDVTTASAALVDFAQSIEARFTELADKMSPQWRATRPSEIAWEAHARDVLFQSKGVQENFARAGLSQEHMPQVLGLVRALFFSIRTSWVHNSTARPTSGDVGHMLQACQLLSDLTLIAEGKPVPHRAGRTEWGVSDLAEAASFHSVAFNQLSRTVIGREPNQIASRRFANFFNAKSQEGAAQADEQKGDAGKVSYNEKYAHELVQGLHALRGTTVLPEPHTTAGVLARAAMVSLWVRLGIGQKCDLDFPLWQTYCEPVARRI